MLSASFKKTLKDTLKNEYEIECHRISPIPDYGYNYRQAILHCSHNNEKFTLDLLIDSSKGMFNGVIGKFNVSVPEKFTSTIASINKKINLDLINASVNEVRKEMVHLLDCYSFHFGHLKIDLIKGSYIKNSEFIDIHKFETVIESDSFMTFYTSLDSGKKCCDVRIVGNDITLKPESGYDEEPIFKESSTLVDSGMDVFKANLAKSIMFYLQIRYPNQERHAVDVATYIPMNYQELQQQFLVYQMDKI